MSRAEVHIVSSQLSRSAPEKSNNARYKSDSVVTSEVQAAIVHPGITDEYVKQKKTYTMDNVDSHYVSVDIPDSTCTCSTPSSCTCSSRKHQTQKQSASDQDCCPTINSDNDNIRSQTADRTLSGNQGSRNLFKSKVITFVLILFVNATYSLGLFMTFDRTDFPSLPILLLALFVIFIGNYVLILYVSYIEFYNAVTDSTLHDSNNHNKSCRGNESDVPTNGTVHIAKDDTDESVIEICTDMCAPLCLFFMTPSTIAFFVAIVCFGTFYSKYYFFFCFCSLRVYNL